MKPTRKWPAASLAVSTALILLMTEAGVAQERARGVVACPTGIEEGTLGISGLDCVGECSITIWQGGEERSWSFSTEPRVIGVEEGGPADGILEAGDFLVAIDGILITTKEGGDRYANLEPGESVSVRYRRDGRVREATIRVGSRCREVPEPLGVTARAPLPPTPPSERRSVGIAVAPRVRVARERGTRTVVEGATGLSDLATSRRASTGILSGASPTGRLGIGFQCTECGTRTDEETGEEVWFFSGPLEVTAVNAGGPADEAGIQRGDLIKAIDGFDIETDEGGLAFTRITPGEGVLLTVVKRNGSQVELSLVPDEGEEIAAAGVRARVPVARAERGVTEGVPVPARRAVPIPGAQPVVPEAAEAPVPAVVIEPPVGMPLRYSGAINGVEIEVRGEPVTVSELKDARTILINAEGLWIRINVPHRVILQGGEAIGVGSVIR